MYILERGNRGEKKGAMGQIVKRSKKGRPPKADPGAKERRQQPRDDLRRSLRRRNVKYVFDLDDYFDEDELFAGDEEHRRRERRLKHLLKIQGGEESESTPSQVGPTRRVEHAPASSASSDDGGDSKPRKKRKIDEDMDDENDDDCNDGDNDNYEHDDEVRGRKPEPKTDTSRIGMPVEVLSASGLLLPEKKVLELILDKLQKKDIYGVYAEPVDPEELPDYHDVIEHPMDFATVRSKLRNGSYAIFEQFESDIFLICSNAMQYNAPDTIYHKQARSIQELAKKKFQKIRLNIEGMDEIKTGLRMGSGSNLKKQIKRPVSRTVQEPVGSDFSSGATLATVGDIQTENSTNILQVAGSEKTGGSDGLVEGNSFLNDNSIDKAEELLSGKGLQPRFGRKPSVQDENRRATYNISLSHEEDTMESIFSTFEGKTKELVPVGLYSDHSYARSLARFAASLGSVPWNVASERIEQALPQDFKYGRGWVGEYEPLPTSVLILENRSVKEPPYLAKVLQPADSRKSGKMPTFPVPSHANIGSVPFLDQRLPFGGPPGLRPPPVSLSTNQPIRNNVTDKMTPFHLAPGVKPNGSPRLNVQHQHLQPMAFATKSDKKIPKQVQVELNGPPSLNANAAANSHGSRHVSEIEASKLMELSSKNVKISQSGSFKQPDSNGVAFRGMHDGKNIGNNANSTAAATSSTDLAKQASNYPHQQGPALTDSAHLMRMSAEKAPYQQKSSNQWSAEAQVVCNDSNNAAAAAARAWMSVGAGGFKPASENPNPNKNQIYASSLYNSTRDAVQAQASRIRPAAGNMQLDKNSSFVRPFVPQDHIPMMMGNVIPFQRQRMAFPQLSAADLSRLQAQSSWRNLSPQMLSPQYISSQKQESQPPDLNIGFQSSGSPAKASSGALVDSQQPDLALQL